MDDPDDELLPDEIEVPAAPPERKVPTFQERLASPPLPRHPHTTCPLCERVGKNKGKKGDATRYFCRACGKYWLKPWKAFRIRPGLPPQLIDMEYVASGRVPRTPMHKSLKVWLEKQPLAFQNKMMELNLAHEKSREAELAAKKPAVQEMPEWNGKGACPVCARAVVDETVDLRAVARKWLEAAYAGTR